MQIITYTMMTLTIISTIGKSGRGLGVFFRLFAYASDPADTTSRQCCLATCTPYVRLVICMSLLYQRLWLLSRPKFLGGGKVDVSRCYERG
jgi:hypothetical protein